MNEDPIRATTIECAVRKLQAVRVANVYINRQALSTEPLPSLRHHGLAAVHPGDTAISPHNLSKRPEVVTCPATYVEQPVSRLGLQQAIGLPLV